MDSNFKNSNPEKKCSIHELTAQNKMIQNQNIKLKKEIDMIKNLISSLRESQ